VDDEENEHVQLVSQHHFGIGEVLNVVDGDELVQLPLKMQAGNGRRSEAIYDVS
jgi:hypothetical protein